MNKDFKDMTPQERLDRALIDSEWFRTEWAKAMRWKEANPEEAARREKIVNDAMKNAGLDLTHDK